MRGLRAFAEAMTAAWSDEARAVEGRPDAQEEAVALFTMHAAKGLEWPIVIPINTMTGIMALKARSSTAPQAGSIARSSASSQRATKPPTRRKAELDRERIRLWYVAATRARELLVLPRLDVAPGDRPGIRFSIFHWRSCRLWTLEIFPQRRGSLFLNHRTAKRVRFSLLKPPRLTSERVG